MQPINNQEAIAMSQPRTSLSNSFTLACMQYTHAGMQVHALSSVQNTHKHTHSSRHRSASLPSRHYKYSKEGHSNLKSDQVSKVYKEHLMYSLMCKYLQATWVKHRTRGHRNSASNRSLKMVLALELLQKTPLSSHLNDIYFGLLQDVGRYTSKLCETVLTFHNDLPIWSAEVKNSRSEQCWSGAEVETGDFQQGSWAWKNLRILATCCFWQHRRQREGSTLFSLFDCKQWGDLKPFTTAMATDFECQPSCAFLF